MTDAPGKIVIVGAGETAELAYEYFTHDSPYEVAALSVEEDYIKSKELCGLPVVPFEDLENRFSPEEHGVFVALSYTQLNRPRRRLLREAKEKGYKPVSYISSRAFVWHNVEFGENCFIFENNVLQYSVKVGDNVVMWSGNHIGHQSIVHDNCFISSHCVISGYCEIGENCFLGVNTTYADHVKVGKDCFIGAGVLVLKDTEPGKVYRGNAGEASRVDSLKLFKVKDPG
jgi:sugar O-acyltransferase (sialic acid O-acetyltransferase NeuD family)